MENALKLLRHEFSPIQEENIVWHDTMGNLCYVCYLKEGLFHLVCGIVDKKVMVLDRYTLTSKMVEIMFNRLT